MYHFILYSSLQCVRIEAVIRSLISKSQMAFSHFFFSAISSSKVICSQFFICCISFLVLSFTVSILYHTLGYLSIGLVKLFYSFFVNGLFIIWTKRKKSDCSDFMTHSLDERFVFFLSRAFPSIELRFPVSRHCVDVASHCGFPVRFHSNYFLSLLGFCSFPFVVYIISHFDSFVNRFLKNFLIIFS